MTAGFGAASPREVPCNAETLPRAGPRNTHPFAILIIQKPGAGLLPPGPVPPAAGYSHGVSVSFQFPLSASQSAFSWSRLRPRP